MAVCSFPGAAGDKSHNACRRARGSRGEENGRLQTRFKKACKGLDGGAPARPRLRLVIRLSPWEIIQSGVTGQVVMDHEVKVRGAVVPFLLAADVWVLRVCVASARTALRRRLAVGVSRLGNGGLYPVLAAVMIVGCGFRGCYAIVAAAINVGLMHSVYPTIKRYAARQRPFHAYADLKPLLATLDEHSFPSGHVMTLTAALVPIVVAVPGALSLSLAAWCAMAWARLRVRAPLSERHFRRRGDRARRILPALPLRARRRAAGIGRRELDQKGLSSAVDGACRQVMTTIVVVISKVNCKLRHRDRLSSLRALVILEPRAGVARGTRMTLLLGISLLLCLCWRRQALLLAIAARNQTR